MAADSIAAATETAAFAVNYVIKRKKSIPSDGQAHRVTISEASYPASLLLVTVPRLAQAAFIEAEVNYTGQEQLLPGEAGLFRNGDFVGRTSLAAVAPNESFSLGFGQDDLVKVERKLIDQKSNPKSGFLAKKGQRRYLWETSIKNFHANSRRVEVREQLPRSRQDKIEVKALEMEPQAQAEDDSKPGLKIWNVEIGAKKEAIIRLGYQVKWPADSQVTGLE
jgi:uncharacterized protein (TIGR02231 family)